MAFVEHGKRFDNSVIDFIKDLDEDMYQFIKSEIPNGSPDEVLNNISRPLLPFKTQWLNVRERLITNPDGTTYSHMSEHWLIRLEDGTWLFPEIKPTQGEHIQHPSKRVIEVYKNEPYPRPKDASHAFVITIGAVQDPDNPMLRRGVSIKGYAAHLPIQI